MPSPLHCFDLFTTSHLRSGLATSAAIATTAPGQSWSARRQSSSSRLAAGARRRPAQGPGVPRGARSQSPITTERPPPRPDTGSPLTRGPPVSSGICSALFFPDRVALSVARAKSRGLVCRASWPKLVTHDAIVAAVPAAPDARRALAPAHSAVRYVGTSAVPGRPAEYAHERWPSRCRNRCPAPRPGRSRWRAIRAWS